MKTNKGFSLIELMVVVAIIGILATIAIPQFQKFQAKAKQSEAKTSLSSMYTSQMAFFAEWNMYYPDFKSIGLAPAGNLRYNYGFTNDTTAGVPGHPNTNSRSGTNKIISASDYCDQNADECTMLLDATTQAAPVLSDGTISPSAFSAQAIGNLDDDAALDTWEIDNQKNLTQSLDDVTEKD